MRRVLWFSVVTSLALAVGCGDDDTMMMVPDSGPDTTIPMGRDEDGDGIADEFEGRASGTDTDGDGTPDYQDTDSDGDGIPDSTEQGGGDTSLPPIDTDSDGTPDFQDNDSDGNGVDDAIEGSVDTDGDGLADYRDLDNDGDSVRDREEVGDPGAPTDFDGDGLPDYLDADSDNDTIRDGHEAIPPDTDGDGMIDRHDLDSDGDGISDADEAGDADISTPPIDSDDDFIPDFRDPDSDNDGLSDADELAAGTSPTNSDSDGDGVTDLIEIGACGGDPECAGDALDPSASPRTRGDFVYYEPYMMPPEPTRDTLDFATNIQNADVYFLMDTTGSMGAAIDRLKTSLSTAGTGIIDRIREEIPNAWFGAGGFDDYRVSPYGSGADSAFLHLQDITESVADAQAGVNRLTRHSGSDLPESLFPALWAIGTGNGLAGRSEWPHARASSPDFAACADGRFGWPCFRAGAVPIIVAITDVRQHNGPGGSDAYNDGTLGGHAPTYAEAVAALTEERIKVVGVAVGSSAAANLNAIATDTGAVDGAGMPLVSTVSSGSGVSDGLIDQIGILANSTRFDISVVYEDDATDAIDSFAAFVDHIEANTAGDAERGCEAREATDTDADGWPDTFEGVTAGSRVCFDIVVKMNDTVMPTEIPQTFGANLVVLGDGFTELDRRNVTFLVPPEIRAPGPD